MPDALKIDLTNGDLYLAMRGPDADPRNALANILKVPQTVLAVRNGSALGRAATAALEDIITARNAALDQHCPVFETLPNGAKNYTVTDAFREAETALMAESVTLTGVRPMKISEFAQGVFVSPDDVMRCGPLLID